MKVLHKTRRFQFSMANRRNPNKRGVGPKYYTISLNYAYDQIHNADEVAEIRKVMDPKGNKGTHRHWVYKDRAEAEKKYNWLMLMWND